MEKYFRKIIYDGVAVQCDLISQDGIKIINMHGIKPYQNFIKSYSQF